MDYMDYDDYDDEYDGPSNGKYIYDNYSACCWRINEQWRRRNGGPVYMIDGKQTTFKRLCGFDSNVTIDCVFNKHSKKYTRKYSHCNTMLSAKEYILLVLQI